MFAYLSLETRKSRREWVFYLLLVVFAGLNIANGIGNYVQNKSIFEVNNVTWLAIWGQGALLWSLIFLPFAIALYCGMLSVLDNSDKNWQRLISYGVAYRTYLAKLLKSLLFVVSAQVLFFLAVLASGLALGFRFDLDVLEALCSWMILGILGASSICSLQLYFGLHIQSYPVLVGVGTVGAFMGLAISLAIPKLTLFFPYSQIILGNHVRELAPFSTSVLLIFLCFNSICLFVPTVLAIAKLRNYCK